jgi:RNAse (barnase) inhibitor barstar
MGPGISMGFPMPMVATNFNPIVIGNLFGKILCQLNNISESTKKDIEAVGDLYGSIKKLEEMLKSYSQDSDKLFKQTKSEKLDDWHIIFEKLYSIGETIGELDAIIDILSKKCQDPTFVSTTEILPLMNSLHEFIKTLKQRHCGSVQFPTPGPIPSIW